MANRIRDLRQERHLNLRELALKVNMSFSNIGSIERGEVQLREDTAKIFADFFGVTIDYLLGLSDERTPPTTKEKLSGVQLALFNQTENLNEEQMKDVLKYIEFLKAKEGL